MVREYSNRFNEVSLMHKLLGAPPTNDSAGGPVKKEECPEIRLKMDNSGYPILPSAEEVANHNLLCKKKLVGKFMSDVYGS